MPFFTLCNVEIDFVRCHIHSRISIIAKVVPTIRWIELIEKKKFATAALDLENKAFIVQINFINQDLDVYPSWKVLLALLKANKTSTSVLPKYIDFADVIFKDLAAELLEYIGMNSHVINLIKGH